VATFCDHHGDFVSFDYYNAVAVPYFTILTDVWRTMQVLLCDSISLYQRYLKKKNRRMRDLPLVMKVEDIPFKASVLILGDSYDVLKITQAAKVRYVEL